jgi:hypothetical protein
LPINELLGLSSRQITEQVLERHKAERGSLLRRNRESEADRAARLEQITILTDLLEVSEADRAARLEKIKILTKVLKDVEADRDARLEQIDVLTNSLKEAEAAGLRTRSTVLQRLVRIFSSENNVTRD